MPETSTLTPITLAGLWRGCQMLTAVEIRAKLVVRVFREQEMLCGCDVAQPRSRVNGRLRPYAAWRSEPLTRRRGDTLRHGSKRGSLALTAMETSAFHPQKDADFHPRQHLVLNDMNLGQSAFDAAQEEAFWKMIDERATAW